MTTEAKAAEPKAEPKATYETREAIMGCGCRIIMDADTYDAEGAHCAVHDNTEVVRVIKNAPVEVPDAPPPPEGGLTAAQKRAATVAASRRR